jgi:hypothetical protein
VSREGTKYNNKINKERSQYLDTNKIYRMKINSSTGSLLSNLIACDNKGRCWVHSRNIVQQGSAVTE